MDDVEIDFIVVIREFIKENRVVKYISLYNYLIHVDNHKIGYNLI